MAASARYSSVTHKTSGQPATCRVDSAIPLPVAARGGSVLLRAFGFMTSSLKLGAGNRQILKMLQWEADAVAEAAGVALIYATEDGARSAVQYFDHLKIRVRETETAVVAGLRGSAISPMTHEDIHSLSVNLRKIVEGLEDVIALPQEILRPEAPFVELSATCAQSIRGAITVLPGSPELASQAMQMAVFARKVDLQLRDIGLARLENTNDALQRLHQRQATRTLRALFRQYRGAARVLEYALIKNG